MTIVYVQTLLEQQRAGGRQHSTTVVQMFGTLVGRFPGRKPQHMWNMILLTNQLIAGLVLASLVLRASMSSWSSHSFFSSANDSSAPRRKRSTVHGSSDCLNCLMRYLMNPTLDSLSLCLSLSLSLSLSRRSAASGGPIALDEYIILDYGMCWYMLCYDIVLNHIL